MLGIMLAFDALHEALMIKGLVTHAELATGYKSRSANVGHEAPTAKIILDVLATRLTNEKHQPLQALLKMKTQGSA